MGNVRVLPLVVFAGLCLLVLKAMGLMLSGGYVLSGAAPASAQNTPAEPAREQGEDPQPKDAPSKAAQPAAEPKAEEESKKAEETEKTKAADAAPPDVTMMMAGPGKGASSKSELAILEGLSDRRKVLDQRARELVLRENLLEAAEKRVNDRISELKAIESRIENELQKRDNRRNTEYQRLVKMYSGMKPKDAARIFDRLDMRVLTDLASQMKPKSMSAILAKMASASAERLTLEIAARGRPKPMRAASLPKIQSK